MPSQGVLNRERVGQAILHAARAHAQEVGKRLQTILAEVLEEGETLPDMILFQHLLARFLERRLEELVAADEAHLAETDDDHDPRQRRDKACVALRAQIASIREAVRVVFDSDQVLNGLSLQGAVPREPVPLLQTGNRILERLRQPVTSGPVASLFTANPFDPEQAVEALQPKIDELDRALSDVSRESRELESSLARKEQSIETFDRAVLGVARSFQGCCALVGLSDLAARIRPTPPQRHAATSRRKEG